MEVAMGYREGPAGLEKILPIFDGPPGCQNHMRSLYLRDTRVYMSQSTLEVKYLHIDLLDYQILKLH